MSDKTKLQWMNGSVIKQGDVASVFKLKLRTDGNAKLNGPAKLQLFDSKKAKLEYDVEVVDNVVRFTLNDVLPVGNYTVEVEHAGYVFPSTDPVVLTVNENLGADFDTEEVATLKKVEIAQEVEKAFAGLRLSDEQVADVAGRITDNKVVISPLLLVGGVYQFAKTYEDDEGNFLDKSQKRLFPFIIQPNDNNVQYLAGGLYEITPEMTLEERMKGYGIDKNKVIYNRLTGQYVLNLDFSFYRFPYFRKTSTGNIQQLSDMTVLLRLPDDVPKPASESEVIVYEDDLVRLQLHVGTDGNVQLYIKKGVAVLNRENTNWTLDEVETIKSRVIKRRILAQLICY